MSLVECVNCEYEVNKEDLSICDYCSKDLCLMCRVDDLYFIYCEDCEKSVVNKN